MVARIRRAGRDKSAEIPLIPPKFTGSDISTVVGAGGSVVNNEVAPGTPSYMPNMPSASASGWDVTNSGNWTVAAWGAVRANDASQGRAYVTTPDGVGGVLSTATWFMIAGPARRLTSYVMQPTGVSRVPYSWVVEGANSAAGPWTVVDTRTDVNTGWAIADRTFTVAALAVAYTHYRWTFQKVYPDGGYLDFYALRFAAIVGGGYTAEASTKIVAQSPRYAVAWVRVRDALIVPGETTVSLSRNGGTNYTAATGKRVKTLADGSHLYRFVADLAAQPAGTNLRVKVATTSSVLILSGWVFAPLAKG